MLQVKLKIEHIHKSIDVGHIVSASWTRGHMACPGFFATLLFWLVKKQVDFPCYTANDWQSATIFVETFFCNKFLVTNDATHEFPCCEKPGDRLHGFEEPRSHLLLGEQVGDEKLNRSMGILSDIAYVTRLVGGFITVF